MGCVEIACTHHLFSLWKDKDTMKSVAPFLNKLFVSIDFFRTYWLYNVCKTAKLYFKNQGMFYLCNLRCFLIDSENLAHMTC